MPNGLTPSSDVNRSFQVRHHPPLPMPLPRLPRRRCAADLQSQEMIVDSWWDVFPCKHPEMKVPVGRLSSPTSELCDGSLVAGNLLVWGAHKMFSSIRSRTSGSASSCNRSSRSMRTMKKTATTAENGCIMVNSDAAYPDLKTI